MTLAQLGEEYLIQEKVLRGRIDELTAKMKGLRGRQMCDLSRRVSTLYTMAMESHRTGIYLLNYYKEGISSNAKVSS